jgi:4-hydroxybenzoate polyprenyltransferase
LAHLQQEKSAGRQLVLATASDRAVAERVARHLGIFSDVVASDGVRNLSGARKAEELTRRFGHRGFDYAGNSLRDVPVWNAAREAIVVRAPAAVTHAAQAAATVRLVVKRDEAVLKAWTAALRPHQWIKNVLLFVPLFMAHEFANPMQFSLALVAWGAFSLTASALYLLNDLFDLAADRRHHHKRHRPFASGSLPLSLGVVSLPVLVVLGFMLALLLPGVFLVTLFLYLLGSASYSFFFKQVVLVDVMMLSSLYTLRLIAGSVATHTPLSFWLVAFSVFFFVSLALMKRVAELVNTEAATGTTVLMRRGYRHEDIPILVGLGASSGLLSVLVLAFYINSRDVTVLYRNPQWLWLICPLLLYWISRTWLLAHRGAMHDDPVVFAVKDKVSFIVGLLIVVILTVAIM